MLASMFVFIYFCEKSQWHNAKLKRKFDKLIQLISKVWGGGRGQRPPSEILFNKKISQNSSQNFKYFEDSGKIEGGRGKINPCIKDQIIH